MDEDGFVSFRRVKHCKLVWLLDNVYRCRTLLKTCIDGPDYGSQCASSFPWLLKLGQSTDQRRKGISLFIKGVNMPEDVLVNFRVQVVEQTVNHITYVLKEEYEALFGGESIWESPLLTTNDDFRTEQPGSIFPNYWDIRVQFMWIENVEPGNLINRVPDDVSSELLDFKELGTDLKQFFGNDRFSDIYIRCGNDEVPAHKAILEARCPYFAQLINSYSGGNWEGEFNGLTPTNDIDVMHVFLLYLYKGDIESLMKIGQLPLGIHKCARRMKRYDLEWLTSPLEIYGCTHVNDESIEHEWIIDNFCGRIKEGDQFLTIRSESFGNNKTSFTLHVQVSTPNYFAPLISVFLQLDELEKGDEVYVIFNLMVKNGEKDVISKKTGGDLTLKSSIGFSGLASLSKFLASPDARFICQISVSENDLSTKIDKMSQNSVINPDKTADEASPMSKFGHACHGWVNLSHDLGQLLMTANYSDCDIVVGGYTLLAHRVILAARSPYFSTVFKVKEEESAGSSMGMDIFVDKDIKIEPEMMKIILKEIYTGSYKIKDSQSAKDIYDFAVFFGLRRLEMKCLKFSEST